MPGGTARGQDSDERFEEVPGSLVPLVPLVTLPSHGTRLTRTPLTSTARSRLKHALTRLAATTALALLLAMPFMLLLATDAAAQGASQGAAQTGCGFSDGFAALRDQVGAETIGECLATPRAVEGGDVHQQTSRGLLVWRAAINVVAFTDGARTWVSGPEGIQVRPNSELFAWEREALARARAKAAQITPDQLLRLYIERVRGNSDVRLDRIYTAMYLMASQHANVWLSSQRVQMGERVSVVRARLGDWLGERLNGLSHSIRPRA